MAGGYVRRILDPATTLDVLREHALVTWTLNGNKLTPKFGADGLAIFRTFHVAAAQRICYFDIRREGDGIPYLSLHLEDVAISERLTTGFACFKSEKTLRPCFYLPYRKNATTRMKLSPPAGFVEPVRFFATAAIDGCSVYIEGPPETPKITHSNANAIAPPVVGENDVARAARIQQKIAHMDGRFAHVRKLAAGPVTAVDRPRYLVEDAPGILALKTAFALRKRIPVAQVTHYNPFATVVGVASQGRWTFYLQKCVKYSYHLRPGGPELDDYVLREAHEFWPNGGGVHRVI